MKKVLVRKWTTEMEKFLLLGEVGPTIKDVCTTVVRKAFNKEFKKRFSSREIWMKSKKLHERGEFTMRAEITEIAPAVPTPSEPQETFHILVDGNLSFQLPSRPYSVILVKEIGSISTSDLARA